MPNQQRTLRSLIKLERQGDDYLITILESDDFEVRIESRLAGQLVTVCESIARFTFGSSCDGLDASLSNPRVPMPEPGKEFMLDSAELTPDQKLQLEEYLQRTQNR